jgi:hypothetical protein
MAAQLTATSGALLLCPCCASWNARASSSLPEPLSPMISRFSLALDRSAISPSTRRELPPTMGAGAGKPNMCGPRYGRTSGTAHSRLRPTRTSARPLHVILPDKRTPSMNVPLRLPRSSNVHSQAASPGRWAQRTDRCMRETCSSSASAPSGMPRPISSPDSVSENARAAGRPASKIRARPGTGLPKRSRSRENSALLSAVESIERSS